MSEVPLKRRDFLRGAVGVAGAALASGTPSSNAAPEAKAYTPSYFTVADGYGAYWYMQDPFHPEAPATLGSQLRQTPCELYRAGIALIDRAAMQAHKKPLAQLDATQRDSLLVQADQGHLPEDGKMAAAFFALLLRNTREG